MLKFLIVVLFVVTVQPQEQPQKIEHQQEIQNTEEHQIYEEIDISEESWLRILDNSYCDECVVNCTCGNGPKSNGFLINTILGLTLYIL